MKKISTVTTAFIAGLSFNGSAIAEDANQLQWLFVHTAQIAEVASPTTVEMPVTREIFAFTDRPNRMHGYMNAHEFVALWDASDSEAFSADPPNAVLTWTHGDVVHEAELLISNAEIGNFGRSISYEVQFETGDTPEGILDRPSLFVDGWRFPTHLGPGPKGGPRAFPK